MVRSGTRPFGNRLASASLIWMAVLSTITGSARADVIVKGTISEDTTWLLEQSPYLVTDHVRLADGVSLTIEAGVVIRVSPEKNIMIEGLLVARGTVDQPIIFTGDPSAVWGNLHFTDFCDDAVVNDDLTYRSGSVLEHCIIEHGKGIYCRFGSPLISNCTIRKNQSSGIRVEYGASVIVDNLIYENSTETDPAAGNGAGIIAFTDKAMVIARNIVRNNRSVDGQYGGGGICAYAYENGFVDIKDNSVFNNFSSTHAGGVFAYKCVVQNNVVVGNRCELKGGGINVIESKVVGNLVEANRSNGGGGMYAENSEVRFNSIVRNRSDSSYGGGIYYFGSGTLGHNTIMYNRSEDASQSAGIYVSGDPSINFNIIRANKGFGIYTGNPSRSPLLDARHNFWGSRSEDGINAALYDWFDDDERGVVNYSGHLAKADDSAPPSPPTGLTVSASKDGIQVKWSRAAGQDALDYTVHYDRSPGYPYSHVINVGSKNTCFISGLKPDTAYYVSITARRGKGKGWKDRSAFSQELSVTFTGRDGHSPDQPKNVLPADGALDVLLKPTLKATFSGEGAGGHVATQWQMTPIAGDYGSPLFDSGPIETPANGLSVPAGIIENGRRYFWRVSEQDAGGNWSEWSAETSFVTAKKAASVLSGPISADATWSREQSPYVMTGNTLVEAGANLTVEPGVIVRMDPGVSFMVRGKLMAVGDPDRPITFTKNSDKPWAHFVFADASADAVFDTERNFLDGSIMKHCVVEYGKGILVEASSPFLTESMIRHHQGSGLAIRKGGPAVIRNQILNNKSDREGGGIYVYTSELADIRDNLIKNNTARADGGGIFAYGYRSTTAINILDNRISGNTSEGNGGGIYGSRVTVRGNTLVNNAAASGGGGVYTTFSIVIRNQFEGNTANQGGGIFAERNSTITYNSIRGNTCRSAHGGGVYINYWGASAENEVFRFNDVTGNSAVSPSDNGGLFVKGQLTFEKNNLYGNAGYELYNGNAADQSPLKATDCYWGTNDPSVIEEKVFHHRDDERMSEVTYKPFAVEKREDF